MHVSKSILTALVLGILLSAAASADKTQVREYFITPRDQAIVSSPVHVVFGLQGMGVAPAGVDMPDTGHHHLIVDAPPPNSGESIPADAQHLHFGHGQTETLLTLPPGKHTLQLVLADANHIPFDPPVMSKRITITVKAAD